MPDVTVQDMCLFLAIIVQVEHDQEGHAERLMVNDRTVLHGHLRKPTKKNLTQDTIDTDSCRGRDFSAVCVALKIKKKEQNAGVKNAILGCVLPHVLRYITPTCMSENQPTLKRESRRHNCQQILPLPLLN